MLLQFSGKMKLSSQSKAANSFCRPSVFIKSPSHGWCQNSAPSSVFQILAFWRPSIVKWSPKQKFWSPGKKGHINDRTLNVSLHVGLVGQMVRLQTFTKCLRLKFTKRKQRMIWNTHDFVSGVGLQLHNKVCRAPFIYFS